MLNRYAAATASGNLRTLRKLLPIQTMKYSLQKNLLTAGLLCLLTTNAMAAGGPSPIFRAYIFPAMSVLTFLFFVGFLVYVFFKMAKLEPDHRDILRLLASLCAGIAMGTVIPAATINTNLTWGALLTF